MSSYSATSQQAFHSVDLDRREREVLAHIEQHFPSAEFTRAQLAESMGWAINRICGRIVSLRDKGLLIEDKQRTVTCPATAGDAHPLRLKNAAGQMPKGKVGVTTLPERNPVQSASAAYVAVIPALFGRPSLSLESANRIVKDSGNAFIEEARAVISRGPHWVWS